MNDSFIDNKYRRWYDQLCQRARGRISEPGTERHHIIPKSLGGSNQISNMVTLTYREHFLAHWLLTKFTTGGAILKTKRALACMTLSKNGRISFSWQFALARKAKSETQRGHKFALGSKRSAETRAKMSAAFKLRGPEYFAKLSERAKNRSADTRNKLRIAASNPSAENRARKSAAATGRKMSAEAVAKTRAAMIGNKRCVGRKLSAETKAKIGAASRNRSAESNAKIAAAQRLIHAKRKQMRDAVSQGLAEAGA